jgi:hypothetical protein
VKSVVWFAQESADHAIDRLTADSQMLSMEEMIRAWNRASMRQQSGGPDEGVKR